jgi:hypothetical protein
MGQILGKMSVQSNLGRVEYGPIECMQIRAEMSRKIKKYLTLSDRQSLIKGMENPPRPNPDDMAVFYAGGKDCLHKNVTPGDQAYLDRLPVLIEQRIHEEQEKQRQQEQQNQNQNTGNNSNGSEPDSGSNGNGGASEPGSNVPAVTQDNLVRYGAYGVGAVIIIGSMLALASN